MRKRTCRAAALLLFGILLLAGCGSKVTAENYAKLSVGMPYAAVVDVLGEPDRRAEKMKIVTCTWGDEEKSITVRFAADRVVFTSKDGF